MKRSSLLSICTLLIIALLCGCGASRASEPDIDKIDKEETYPSVPGQLETVYTNFSEIIADADDVAMISVVDSRVEMLDGYPQTHTEVEITSVYKGDIQEGDCIEVIEEGGYNGKVLGGIPQLSSENSYFLCLREYKGDYYICGAFQGRFIEREGYIFQQATEDVKLQKYSPLSVNNFEVMLQETVVAENVAIK